MKVQVGDFGLFWCGDFPEDGMWFARLTNINNHKEYRYESAGRLRWANFARIDKNKPLQPQLDRAKEEASKV